MCTCKQAARSHKCTCRQGSLEVTAIYFVESGIVRKIGCEHLDPHKIIHGHPGLLDRSFHTVEDDLRADLGISRGLPRRRVQINRSGNIQSISGQYCGTESRITGRRDRPRREWACGQWKMNIVSLRRRRPERWRRREYQQWNKSHTNPQFWSRRPARWRQQARSSGRLARTILTEQSAGRPALQ